MTKLCPDCGREITRGGSANGVAARCLVCRTETMMRGWHWPAARPRTPEQKLVDKVVRRLRREHL